MKKQGMLQITFNDSADYKKVQFTDKIAITWLEDFQPGKYLNCVLSHASGSSDNIVLDHTFNKQQINWFKAGSALNWLGCFLLKIFKMYLKLLKLTELNRS